jgi:hypothetical protein
VPSLKREAVGGARGEKRASFHDWTSHAADVHRYAAVAEDRMKNQTLNPPATSGIVKPFYPGLGV